MTRVTRFDLWSRMSEWVSRRKQATNYLRLSIRRRRMGWESVCPSAAPLLRLITAAYGRSRTTDRAQPLPFVYLAAARTSVDWRQPDQICPKYRNSDPTKNRRPGLRSNGHLSGGGAPLL